jgi:hypothetical protein
MTARAWLDGEARRARRASWSATVLGLVAVSGIMLAAGGTLARVGVFGVVPELVLAPWVATVVALAVVLRRRRRAHRATSAAGIGSAIEGSLGLRRGALSGIGEQRYGSSVLADLADRRMAEWLDQHGPRAVRALRGGRRRELGVSLLAAVAGLGALAVTGVRTEARALWDPLGYLRAARAPVRLAADRQAVARGDLVTLTIEAPGRDAAELLSRRAGESWQVSTVALAGGTGRVEVGPLEADLVAVARSGGRESDTVRVAVRPGLFFAELTITARFPAYLRRPDEPLPTAGDTVWLPVGAELRLAGRTSLPLTAAAWVRDGQRFPLEVEGAATHGTLRVRRSGTIAIEVAARDARLEGAAPRFTVLAVADSAPVVTLPVPGADTVAPTSLMVPLVIEARDDHLVTRVVVVSRRVSRLGTQGAPATTPVSVPAEGLERAVLATALDLNGRGFLPGDTAYVKVRAYDNAPRPGVGESREYRLRLPSLAELRRAVREEAEGLAAAADSVARAQRAAERAVEDLARERRRGTTAQGQGRTTGRDEAEFRQVERTSAVGAEQRAVLEQAERLRERLAALERTAWEAGLTDPALQQQLTELRELLTRALTPELEAALRDLERALSRLDADAMRDALERLAAAQEQLRRDLERSRGLFERAAVEGQLTTLAEDAAELAARQREWNQAAAAGVDSGAAAIERRLAEHADTLAERVTEAERQAARTGAAAEGQGRRAQTAAEHMRAAAGAAAGGGADAARRAGTAAAEELDPLAESLIAQRDELREQWRREVLEALDRALVETADLARAQDDVTRRLARGESGPELRAAQGAVRDGLDRVLARIQNAAGLNALVSPTLGGALGYSRNRMGEALAQLQQGAPNTRSAGEAAGEALDGLNTLALQLLRSRSDVSGAASGSGLQEAVERMTELAKQQGAMAWQSGGMLPLMQSAGQAMLEQLRELARQQRALAAELERLRAQGDLAGAGDLAEQAEEIARTLEAGTLTRQTVERQEQLYRRLLDAGRLLRGSEEDEEKERQSTTARPGNVLLPSGARPADTGPRFRYPTWEELRGLTPAERRAVLDYFRTLNDGRRP